MRQCEEEFEDAVTQVWVRPDSLDDSGFEDEPTGEFALPADLPDLPPLPVLDIDMSGLEDDADTAVTVFKGPPPVKVEILEPVFDPDLPGEEGGDIDRDSGTSIPFLRGDTERNVR